MTVRKPRTEGEVSRLSRGCQVERKGKKVQPGEGNGDWKHLGESGERSTETCTNQSAGVAELGISLGIAIG